ncbi:dynein intermediate chain 1, axonemal, putative [Pediculus humanus corporis]|uniref:Dynein intermediate chain 1, axonemal, putative n=1 Tax=Pediculus humanus subsp. corporis TaxID=121224 RepID=E0W2G7_PEDHC|nr:dynein intermediate chain 1, axonemal, putative [Pediculus humanus corporis]EEB19823.1 dynein intermediate chain 1, axonemal, putative [Pediculus humanus corporis]
MKSKNVKSVSDWSPKRLPNSYNKRMAVAVVGSSGKKPPGKHLKGDDVSNDDFFKKKSDLIKPDDQLCLTDAQLNEEITRTLTTGNMNSPKNLVEYSYKLGEFVSKSQISTTIVLIRLEGCCILKNSPEAQAQIAAGDWSGDEIKKSIKSKSNSLDKESKINDDKSENEGEDETEEGNEEATDGKKDDEDKAEEEEVEAEAVSGSATKPKKKLVNAFNYCERSSQTADCTKVNAFSQTIPPPRKVFSELVTQWIIYDAYAEDFEKQKKEKEKEKKLTTNTQANKKDDIKKKQDLSFGEGIHNKTNEAAKIIDRMICQNIYDDIAHDYKYYEDPADEFRREGTLLPLWKFFYERKKTSVTDISWNPFYYDLFAVTFGTFEFLNQRSQDGAVCLFTLKNPSYPEYVRITESSAMCVATHPTQTYLIAVGLLDGNVAVYNTHLPDKFPQHRSNSVNKKHCDAVWQVEWGANMQDGEVNFFSVSADGKVCNWVLMQNELALTTVASLSLPLEQLLGPDGLPINMIDSGCCITFHPTQPLIFLVGTEEGSIYKCSTAYSSTFLFKYDAHYMPVHKISYNSFYPDVFLSCSADWRIKIWEDSKNEPLFVFDLGCSVGDVQWAPYSSTVFGAVTIEGKCVIFDINIDKYKPICVQSIASRKKNGLTRLKFNFKVPIIAVGDDKGNISVLKLSPNLRIKSKPPKKQQFFEPEQLEIIKLEKLLALILYTCI